MGVSCSCKAGCLPDRVTEVMATEPHTDCCQSRTADKSRHGEQALPTNIIAPPLEQQSQSLGFSLNSLEIIKKVHPSNVIQYQLLKINYIANIWN